MPKHGAMINSIIPYTIAFILFAIFGLSLRERFRAHCPLHKVKLLQGKSKMVYGYPAIPKGYFMAAKRSFPWANTFTLCGKVPRDKKVKIDSKYCPSCRMLEEEWISQEETNQCCERA